MSESEAQFAAPDGRHAPPRPPASTYRRRYTVPAPAIFAPSLDYRSRRPAMVQSPDMTIARMGRAAPRRRPSRGLKGEDIFYVAAVLTMVGLLVLMGAVAL